MAILTREQVEHVARLARLALREEQIETFRTQLSATLEHIDSLNRLDTSDVPPTAMVGGLHDVLRPDVSRPSWPVAAVLANAPERESDYFRVPAVLDEAQIA
jgi:aspartyl-tRNA(Asn)/glutamyl-tRNA(Gln) amidotransferase subunit C